MRYMITATGTIDSFVADTDEVRAGVTEFLASHPQTIAVEAVTVERVPEPVTVGLDVQAQIDELQRALDALRAGARVQ